MCITSLKYNFLSGKLQLLSCNQSFNHTFNFFNLAPTVFFSVSLIQLRNTKLFDFDSSFVGRALENINFLICLPYESRTLFDNILGMV